MGLIRYFEYTRQQRTLRSVAEDYGVVYYLPEYHGKGNDANTVLFYLQEDEHYNQEIERGLKPFAVYRRPFWIFDNTDADGNLNYQYACKGNLCLKGLNCRLQIMHGMWNALTVHLKNLLKEQRRYPKREENSVINDLSRQIIATERARHGKLYLGTINFSGQRRKDVIAGHVGIYQEYTGQLVRNFEFAFCIPQPDRVLEQMIRDWNATDHCDGRLLNRIYTRIERCNGKSLIWV